MMEEGTRKEENYLKKKIYLDGEACSFAKTLKGAETGCKCLEFD